MAAKYDGIHFLITGGTIDSYYEGSKDTVVPNKESVIPQYVKSLKLPVETEFTIVCIKDSRDLTEKDRQKVLETIEKSRHKKIIVLHGTYTMPETARFIKSSINRKDQTIILTGSMIPIKDFAFSDAPFNMGFALANLNSLKPGVYACMNGNVFSPEEVKKIVEEGRFASIFQEK